MAWSDLLPWNWGSGGASSGYGNTDSPITWAPGMTEAGYQVSSPMPAPDNSGGMNWAGLSSGLSNLSKSLGSGSSSSSSDKLQTSPSVASTVSGGVLTPAGGGGGASALGSVLANRNQLAQALIMAAMQGKGRGKSGGGLLG